MTYAQLKQLKPRDFKRRCGVQPETLAQMVEVLRPQLERRGKRGGQTVQAERRRPTAARTRILVRISNTVSHCYKLGTKRISRVPIDSDK